MHILTQQSVFSSMLQDGPFAIENAPPLAHPFSRQSKDWVRSLRSNQLLRTKYRALRNQIFDLLGINNFDEILALIHNQRLRDRVKKRSYRLLGNMFGLNGTSREVVRHLHEYARTADDVLWRRTKLGLRLSADEVKVLEGWMTSAGRD